MDLPILSREQTAQRFAISRRMLMRYESRGLVHPVRLGEIEGYGPAELRRLGTIVSLQRDLGINLAGVEAVLRLRVHIDKLHQCLTVLADQMRAAVDDLGEDEHEA
jgi:MerR family transcriptional regulator/heat shock protein HspR